MILTDSYVDKSSKLKKFLATKMSFIQPHHYKQIISFFLWESFSLNDTDVLNKENKRYWTIYWI